jgi:glycosyltransferase involved in cell wall biosynthesis
MRVLWVKAGKLLPVDTGGKIRSYNLLRHLVGRHEIVLLSYYGQCRDLEYEREIRRQFPDAEPVHTGVPAASALHYARHTLSAAPYAVTKFTSPRVRGLVSRWLAERRFDVAVCDFLSASLNFPETSPTPCVLFQHNVETILWQRQANYEPNAFRRLAYSMEARKMSRYERAAVARFSHVIAVSERDRDAMIAMTDPARVSVVPTGVDVGEYRAAAETTAVHPTVLFLGSMDWEANIDAVEYFCREIWPAVRAAVPDARFRIVGRNPHPRVSRLASASVEVTGTVPSVIDHLKETAVFAVPLRVGGGTRLKIFEAMAAGRAVVSTSVGAEGLGVADGHDIVLADTGPRFAEAVVGLLRDPIRRASIGRAAVESAARNDWQAVAKRLETILSCVAASAGFTREAAQPVRARA